MWRSTLCRPQTCRMVMLTTEAKRVDCVFSQLPPAPPHSLPPFTTFPSTPPHSVKHWKADVSAHRKLYHCLQSLHKSVGYNRHRIVEWPVESSDTSRLPLGDYMQSLISPIAKLLNTLHSPELLQGNPMGCVKVELGNFIVGATFTTKEFKVYSVYPPYILFVPDELFEPDGQTCSAGLKFAFSKISDSASSVIVTNFKDIAVFFMSKGRYISVGKDIFIKVETSHIPAALRTLAAACLLDALPPFGFMNGPDLDAGIWNENFILPMGPPQNPDQPLHSDEHLIATCNRNSDFDLATLLRDRNRALQFFRWNKHALQRKSELVTRAKDILHGTTNQRFNPAMQVPSPLYPFDPSEMPSDTKNHLQMIYCVSPLAQGGLDKALAQSKSFALQIDGVLEEGERVGFCSVYRCRLTSIDGHPVSSSPLLCLKLFDDRFQDLHHLIDYEDPFPLWFGLISIAEDCTDNETIVYNKLRPVQGTVIPWFYGQHQFILPNGVAIQGLLMEYIDGYHLDSKRANELSSVQQIQVIQSCRHAVRVLDAGDITQMDWHDRQFVLYTHPTAQVECVVLLDFSVILQTFEPDFINFRTNCLEMLSILVNSGPTDGGLDSDLIFQYYEDPDTWDPTVGSVCDKKGRRKLVEYNGTMFPFIKLEPPPPLELARIST
ncbi:hypothetical protein JR316_0004354 [Psilocybe cubensis]|uniref:Uncharacterized protein n=2 Tax=Psilocybe cubensis TaxID=181762 RepID=A0ACB8H309_PSICU|nr:hypothetical protein JR316_0004354 [Psilocybe cubensis]KAH9482256.1 hypothetical protein JR316_0004354 [Psilocybe cubensis]